MWKPPTLETDRLNLRPLNVDDAPDIFSYAKNIEVSQYTLWQPHKNLEDSIKFISEYAFQKYQEEELKPLAVCLKSDGDSKMIGTVGCYWKSKTSNVMELAYALSQDYWGKGIMTEASHAIIDYCFENTSVNRICARFKSENIGSGRVMEKLEMTYEGTMRSELFHNGRYWDMKYFSVLKSEWMTREQKD